jgi:cupin fold WbuC family metalloprotein
MERILEPAGEGVWIARGGIVVFGPAEVAFLKEHVGGVARRRARICAHPDLSDPLQEMLILLLRDTYIRPHRHRRKAESLLVVEGEADAVFFDDDGAVATVLPLGDPRSGKAFSYRIDGPRYHTLLPRSEHFVFHEATLGPFAPELSEAAPWAPPDGDPAAAGFIAALRRRLPAPRGQGV